MTLTSPGSRVATTHAAARGLTCAWGLALASVLAQISYPLLSGTALTVATVASVLLFAAASTTHAGAVFGARTAAAVLVAPGVLGLLAETVGVHTGYPFGEYRYTDTLGPQLAGVPLVVPLAWAMMTYPCLLLARRLAAGSGDGPQHGGRRLIVALTGGVALAAWDLFLDPQMVAAGHWAWAWPDPHLPGLDGIPLTNYAGWLLVGTLMTAVLDRLVPRAPRLEVATEAVPAALLAWTWAGSTLANLVFFDRPVVALYGGPALGAVVLPYLVLLRRAAVREGRR